MGFWQSLLSFLNLRKKCAANILIIGLDNSGKSSVILRLKVGNSSQELIDPVVPTIGFQSEIIRFGRLTLTAVDMSGQSRYRNLWERYYASSHGIVFVVDSSDAMRMAVASNELHLMVQHPDMQRSSKNKDKSLTTTTMILNPPILVLANKIDLENAIPTSQIRAEMRLDEITSHSIHLAGSNALTGTGLDAAFQWLSTSIVETLNAVK